MAYNTDDRHGIIRKQSGQRANSSSSTPPSNSYIGWIILVIVVLILLYVISNNSNNSEHSQAALPATTDSVITNNTSPNQNTQDAQTSETNNSKDTNPAYTTPVDSSSGTTNDSTFPSYPKEQQIKSDLIGKSFGNWQINNLDEFKRFIIKSNVFQNGRLYITIDLNIEDSRTSKLYDAEIWAYYINANGGWVFSGADDNYHRDIVTDNSQVQELSTHDSTVIPIANTVQSSSSLSTNFNRRQYLKSQTRIYNRNRRYDDLITPFKCECTFNRNTRLSTTSSGEFTILDNVTFIINVNAIFTGNVYLYKNATLIVNGQLNGNVINNGGTIIQNIPINGTITNNSNQ